MRTLQYILFRSMADFDLYLLDFAEKRPDERLRKLFRTDLERELASFNKTSRIFRIIKEELQ